MADMHALTKAIQAAAAELHAANKREPTREQFLEPFVPRHCEKLLRIFGKLFGPVGGIAFHFLLERPSANTHNARAAGTREQRDSTHTLSRVAATQALFTGAALEQRLSRQVATCTYLRLFGVVGFPLRNALRTDLGASA